MSNMDIVIAYETLGIEANAPIEVIISTFRKLSILYHPDNYRGDTKKYVKILQAFKYLKEMKQSLSAIRPVQLNPTQINLNLTLEEIFTGCEKEVIIVRNNIDKDGNVFLQEKVPIKVSVVQGIQDGTQITVKNVGDWQSGKIQANVNFFVCQIEHPIFKRNKPFNVEYRAKITYNESLHGCQIKVPTLERDFIPLDLIGIVDKEKLIPNRGFISPDGKKRGNLIVKFDVCSKNVMVRDPPIEHDIYITLEQFLFGYIKKVKLNLSVIDTDGKKHNEDKIFELNIRPGTKIGHEFTFLQAGNQNSDSIPADLIFVIKEKPHPTFKRFETVHLEYVTLITSSERRIEIPTLENDLITMVLDDDIENENNYRIIKNRGLPYPNNASKRGNLIVRFKIEQNPPIISNVYLTPQEMLNGCVKKFELICSKNDFSKNIESKKFKLNIPRGCKSGEEFIFPMNGNRMFRKIPADIVFVVWKFDNSKQHYKQTVQQNETVLDFPLSLEDVLSGVKKVEKFKRRIISSATKSDGEMFEKVKFAIDVLPGIKRSTEFRFEREGHQNVDAPPGDVVFVARILPHENFTREGADLIYTRELTRDNRIIGLLRIPNRFIIPTLDGVEIPIKVDKEEFPFLTTVRILQMGLPKVNQLDNDKISRGDLVIQLINNISDDEIQKSIERKSLDYHILKLIYYIIENPKIDSHLLIDVPLSLLDVLNGIKKEIPIFYKIIDNRNENIYYEKKIFEIEIKPGTKIGKEFKFPFKGDHSEEGLPPADVIFVTTDEPHEVFKREDNDLHYTARISQYNANLMVPILTLESTEPVWFHVPKPVNEFTILRIAGLGLPCLEDVSVRGDILVNFEITDLDDKDLFNDESLTQNPPLEHEINLSLLQVMNGCTYKAVIYRLASTGRTEIKPILIEIKPGIKSDTKFIVPKGGGRISGKIPSDVIFVVKDEKHKHLTRKGANLEYCVKLPRIKIGKRFKIKIPVLESGMIDFKYYFFDEKVSEHDCNRTIEGLGLPHADNPKKRGNLQVVFKIYDEEFGNAQKNNFENRGGTRRSLSDKLLDMFWNI